MRRPILFVAVLVFVLVVQAAYAAPITLVQKGSTWKYFPYVADFGTAWKEPVLDESEWGSGPAPVGFGDPFVKTTVPSGFITYYFRQAFAVDADPASFTKLTMTAAYDDGMIVYLNGKEVLRKGLPDGAVTFEALAKNHSGSNYETIDVTAAKDALRKGVNVIAVEVHQTSITSSDIVLDMEIVAE